MMEDRLSCPLCHIPVRQTDYFCFNCGTSIHPKPLSTSFSSQTALYVKSIIFLPLGIIWGMRYFKQPDRASKAVGTLAITLTVITLVIVTKLTVDFINSVNVQVGKQLQMYQGF